VTWASLAVVLGGLSVFYATVYRERRDAVLKSIPASQGSGRAAVGGPFRLVDAKSGKPFTDVDLRGDFGLLYFGFTFCPDICPDELDKITEGLRKADGFEEKAHPDAPALVRPVFITIDPERDTAEAVAEYLEDFHPRFVGLVGSPDSVREAARAFRVYYHKTAEESDGGYLIDHSIICYLLDPNGDFVTFFGRNNTADDIADVVRRNVREWRRSNPGWRPGQGSGGSRTRSTGERQAMPKIEDDEAAVAVPSAPPVVAEGVAGG